MSTTEAITLGAGPYDIVPVLDYDSLTTQWSLKSHDPWPADASEAWLDGFESLEAAAKCMEANGKTPPIRAAERRRLDHMLGALGEASPLTPDDLAEVITDAYDIAKLARFAVKFRQLYEEKVMRINPLTGLTADPNGEPAF